MTLGLLVTGCAGGAADQPAGSPSTASDGGASAPSEPSQEATEPAAPVELIIGAAASLTLPLTEIADNYMADHPNVTIKLNFASSGNLQTQIENGAPTDIFFSAATKQMTALEDQDLILDGSRVELLRNEIVLIVPADSALGLDAFEDAASDAVTSVAVGDPASVPAGQYAEQAFTFLGIWDAVSAKAVLGSDVKQVLSWVSTAEADCGVVFKTDAISDGGVRIIAMAPDGSHNAVVYPVAVVKASAQPDAAAAFIEYLKTDAATAVFEANGFLPF
jgi:molybdate transport system substrate-binding protein